MASSSDVVGSTGPPWHLVGTLRYFCTIPDLMGYSQVLCVLVYPLAHVSGKFEVVAAAHMLKELIDCFDGMVARRIGQCSSFGGILDLATGAPPAWEPI